MVLGYRVAGVIVSVLLALTATRTPIADAAIGTPALIKQLVDGPQRSPGNKARDKYRNPAATLMFLEVTRDARVIEITPGGGYWTEILAPFLKERGKYIAAAPKDGPEGPSALRAKMEKDPANYSRMSFVEFSSRATEPNLGPPGSADVVLTFRNLHNWIAAGTAEKVIAAFHKVLRRGGVLGIEEHRGRTGQPQDPAAKSGYVREDYAIALIEKAGFRFAGKSEVNANPKDTKDYPDGVWTLPPTYRLGDKDKDKYTAIGESDRFLMKFVKR
jgi:predicted methyltransferase